MSDNIVIVVPSKAGSSFIGGLLRCISSSTRWISSSTRKQDAYIGPYRSNIPLIREWKYVVQLRDPMDHIISRYNSIVWDHSYLGDPNRLEFFESKRQRYQAMTIDEFCLWYCKDLVAEMDHLIKISYQQDSVLITYEEMWNDYDSWILRFLEPFELVPNSIKRVVEKYRPQVHVNPGFLDEECTKAKLRHGVPGEHAEVLKQSTIDVLRHEFYYISRRLNDLGHGSHAYLS